MWVEKSTNYNCGLGCVNTVEELEMVISKFLSHCQYCRMSIRPSFKSNHHRHHHPDCHGPHHEQQSRRRIRKIRVDCLSWIRGSLLPQVQLWGKKKKGNHPAYNGTMQKQRKSWIINMDNININTIWETIKNEKKYGKRNYSVLIWEWDSQSMHKLGKYLQNRKQGIEEKKLIR